jgi:hypothetical protein
MNRRSCEMNCRTDQIRAAWAAGDRIGALRIAARFFDRSADTRTFQAWHGRLQQSELLPAARQEPRTAYGICVGVIGEEIWSVVYAGFIQRHLRVVRVV